MKTLIVLFILLFACTPCFGHGNGLPDSDTHYGGCSTASYIDSDCDGYGIGMPGIMLGPDADDTDPAVNTSASAIAKYGTMEAFIKGRMQKYMSTTNWYNGTSGGGILRFIVVDQINGKNTTAVKSSSLATALANPYQTSSSSTGGYNSKLLPGDCIIIRGPTYSLAVNFGLAYGNGTTSNPIYFIPYPGETINLTYTGVIFNIPRSVTNSGKNIVIDGMGGGFRIDRGTGNHSLADTFYAENLIIREASIGQNLTGSRWTASESKNVLCERVVFYGAAPGHTIYFTGHADLNRTKPNGGRGIMSKFRGNRFFTPKGTVGSGYPVIQFNGGQDDFLFEENVFHSEDRNFQIAIVNGADGGIIRNNVSFGAPVFVEFYWYRSGDSSYRIACFGINNVKISNNTVYIPVVKGGGASNDFSIFHFWKYDVYTASPAVTTYWQPNTSFGFRSIVRPAIDNGCVYGVYSPTSGSGISGGIEPVWPLNNGETVLDSGLRWFAICNNSPMKGIEIRKNILVMDGTGSDQIFLFYKIFPDPNREVPIIEDNILFKINHADDKMRTMSNRGVNDSTFTNYTFEEFQAFSPNIRNNIWADPMFISVDHTNNWDLSGTVNLGVQPGSPAAGYGSTLTGGVTPPPPPTDRTGEEGIIRMNLSDS